MLLHSPADAAVTCTQVASYFAAAKVTLGSGALQLGLRTEFSGLLFREEALGGIGGGGLPLDGVAGARIPAG